MPLHLDRVHIAAAQFTVVPEATVDVKRGKGGVPFTNPAMPNNGEGNSEVLLALPVPQKITGSRERKANIHSVMCAQTNGLWSVPTKGCV